MALGSVGTRYRTISRRAGRGSTTTGRASPGPVRLAAARAVSNDPSAPATSAGTAYTMELTAITAAPASLAAAPTSSARYDAPYRPASLKVTRWIAAVIWNHAPAMMISAPAYVATAPSPFERARPANTPRKTGAVTPSRRRRNHMAPRR